MIADDILDLKDLKTKNVEVPQWGKTLTVQELDLEGGLRLFQLYANGDGELDGTQVAEIVSLGVVDDNGDRLFPAASIPKLAKKNRDALLLLFREITELSQEDAKKN